MKKKIKVDIGSKTHSWAFALVIFCTLLTATGQILLKKGMSIFSFSSVFANWFLLIGFFIYAISAVLLVISLKGGELSILYPLIATSFVWVSIASPYFFSTDHMNFTKWLGILSIVVGISVMGVASRK